MDSLPWIVRSSRGAACVALVGVWLRCAGRKPPAAAADRMGALGAPGLFDR